MERFMKGTGEMESNTAQASISGVMVGNSKGFGRMVIKYRKSRGFQPHGCTEGWSRDRHVMVLKLLVLDIITGSKKRYIQRDLWLCVTEDNRGFVPTCNGLRDYATNSIN